MVDALGWGKLKKIKMSIVLKLIFKASLTKIIMISSHRNRRWFQKLYRKRARITKTILKIESERGIFIRCLE